MFLNRLVSRPLLAHRNQFNLQPQTSSSQCSSRIPRHCSISSSSPPATMNTSPPTQRSLLIPFQPANAQFENAKGVVVNGRWFTNAKGDVVNNISVDVIINLAKHMPGFKKCHFSRTHSWGLETENRYEPPVSIAQPPSMEQVRSLLFTLNVN